MVGMSVAFFYLEERAKLCANDRVFDGVDLRIKSLDNDHNVFTLAADSNTMQKQSIAANDNQKPRGAAIV